MKKHMPKLLALVLTLLLTLALLPVPPAQAAAYDDDPNFVVPAPSNLELSFRADGKCTIKFNNNLGEDFILSERFRMVVEIYNADTHEKVHESSHFYNWLNTGAVTEKTFDTSLGAGNYYAKLYNRLTVGGSSLAEKARSEAVTSNTATLDPNAKVVYDIEFTRCKLNYQPGESVSIRDYAVASGKPYSINGVVWNRYPADENGNPQASDCFWSSEYSSNTNRFTTFEKGYFYRCTVIFTTPKDGYSWAPSGLGASLNGEKLDFSPKVITGGIHLVQSGYLDLTSSKEITQAAVSGATLTLPASGLPAFTASVPDGADYEIDDEAWMDENGKYYTSNESKNAFLEAQGLLLTELADGKTYTYSVTLKPKDSKHAFPKDLTQIAFTFDGKSVPLTSANATLANGCLMVDHLAACTVRNVVTDFAVENATLSLQPGAAPIDDPGKLFTGKAPDGAAYILEWELWYCIEDHTSFTSSRPGNEERRALNMLLTSFEPGKTYVYYVRLALRDGEGTHLPANQRDIRLTLNGQLVDKRYVTMDSFNKWVYGNEPVTITLPAQSGGGNPSFTEPDYYPDYSKNEDVAPAAAPAPAIPGRDESDTAPKTADAPILPTLLLAALSALVLVRAKKRLCR